MKNPRQDGRRKDATGSKTTNVSVLYVNNHSINYDDHCIIITPFECYIGIFFITSKPTKTPGAELPDSYRGASGWAARGRAAHGSPAPVHGREAAGPNDIYVFHVLGTQG